MSSLHLTTYQELKDKLVGPIGSAERTQFEQELAALAAAKLPRKPTTRKPRE